MMLDDVALNVPVRIVDFASDDESELARWSGLGVRAGVTVTKLLSTPLQDPIECLIGPQLLALERRALKKIRVERLP